jgi:hypothetical protein
MPSDRSTLHRGAPGGDPQSAWQDPTAPSGRRPPSTPRERKPALAALAVLLILGCALGTGFLVIQSGKRVAAVEISQQIGAGERIPLSAMTEVQIASGTGLAYVPWNQASQVARFFAASAIPPGTLLTQAMVASASASTAGKDVVGLALKDGQLPLGLQIGQHINIFAVSDASEACPGSPGSVIAANAIVVSVSNPGVGSGSSALKDVEVALAPAAAGPVACNASNGIVGIAILPNGGRGAAAQAGSGGTGGSVPQLGQGGTGSVSPSPGSSSGSVSPSSGTH